MKCTTCSKSYDSKKKTPRLLIKCGHTACQECLIKLFKSGCVKCPQCLQENFGETIEDFPKNLALLEMKGPKTSDAKPKRRESSAIFSDGKIIFDRSCFNTRSSDEEYCQIHKKKYEAFCTSRKKLMCIGCILENKDKSQNLIAIEQALEIELEEAKDFYSGANNLEEKIEVIKDDITDFLRNLNLKKQENEIRIEKFFENIVKEVRKRKDEVNKKMM